MTGELERIYADRRERVLSPVAHRLETLIADYCSGVPHIDRVSARAKSTSRFVAKAGKTLNDGNPKYSAPLHQIQDQVGARVVVFYSSDVEIVSGVLEKYLRRREATLVEPESDAEFAYFGKHYVFEVPADAVPGSVPLGEAPEVFECQIKTLFQHAWSEANHDLGYKARDQLTPEHLRLLAFSSAQAWGADRVFEQLVKELTSDGNTEIH